MKRLLIGLLLVVVCSSGAETLIADYFDILTGSTNGTEVTGRIHLRSNKDAHDTPIPTNYTFVITSDPSGIFEIEDQRETFGRLLGALKVAPGQTVSASPTDYPIGLALFDGSTTQATASITVKAVSTRLLDELLIYSEDYAFGNNRLWGRKYFSDSEVASYVTELEGSAGVLSGFDFYTQPLTSFANTQPVLELDLEEAASIIGGLGYAYMTSSTYGPSGNAAERARLKAAIYDALEAFADRLPMDPDEVIYNGQPIGDGVYGDGFFGLNQGMLATSYNFLTHPWRIFDPLVGPSVWLMPDILDDYNNGDAQAIRLRQKLVEFFQMPFGLNDGYYRNPVNRWGDISDPDHFEGAISDANMGHLHRSWLSLPAIWGDYNRPITYMPYWYDGYYDSQGYPGAQLKAGWEPNGVLDDLQYWFSDWHLPAHLWGQSGFQPDGTVTHHLFVGASDVAMNAYGYGWLVSAIDGYELFKNTDYDMGNEGFQFIADRYLYSYDKFIYKADMDFSVVGRSYFSDMGGYGKFVDAMSGDINRLLAAKQAGTVITNETELTAWRDAVDNGTHEVSGNFPFWVGQSLVHRRGDGGEEPYYFSVKLKHDRTAGAEDFDSIKKTWHAGSGILQAKVRGDEYDKTRYNWDWHALPGLTEEWRTDAIVWDRDLLKGVSPYGGMASDGTYGFAAMEYRSAIGSYSVAEADKAWFFTEKEAIALGKNVDRFATGQNLEIITTIDQTLWEGTVTYSIDGASPVTISQGLNTDITLNPSGISWLHQGEVGYVIFPQGSQPLTIRGGDSVNITDPAKSTGEDVIHFALGHGTDPAVGGLTKYHYVVVPNKTAAEMPAYITDLTNRVEIVANNGVVQGIYDSSLELLQVAFYAAGSASTAAGLEVSSDREALVQMRRVSGDWKLAVTDPEHEYAATEINLTVSEYLDSGTYAYNLPGTYPLAGESMIVSTISSGATVRVELPDPTNDSGYNYQGELYAGAPLSATLYLGGPPAGPLAFTTLVWEDDFDSYAPNTPVPTDDRWTYNLYNENNEVYVHTRVDTNSVFGLGAGNQYLGLRDAGGTSAQLFSRDVVDTELLRLSFDFAEPGNGLNATLRCKVGIDDVKSSDDEVVGGVKFDDGNLTPGSSYAYSPASHHLDIYFNESAETIEYLDPNSNTASLASGKMDVWLNGILDVDDVQNDRAQGTNALSTIRSLRLETYSSGQSEVWFDNLELAIPVATASSVYDLWAFSQGLSGTNAVMTADPDVDGLNNLGEFALGGVPTNGTDAAALFPTIGKVDNSVFEYIHRRRTDAEAAGLIYTVECSSNLVSGNWSTNGIVISGTAPAEIGFETVTNEISTSSEDEQFLRLKISAD
jgi:hypothetical protein